MTLKLSFLSRSLSCHFLFARLCAFMKNSKLGGSPIDQKNPSRQVKHPFRKQFIEETGERSACFPENSAMPHGDDLLPRYLQTFGSKTNKTKKKGRRKCFAQDNKLV